MAILQNAINANSVTPLLPVQGGLGVSDPTAHGILVGEGASAVVSKVLTDGQLLIGSTGADPVGAGLTAGAGITITPAAGAITIASSSSAGGGWTWNDITAATVTMAAGNAYIADDAAGSVQATLPAAATVGDSYLIVGGAAAGSTGWAVLQNAGQSIIWGNTVTTVGAGGSITSGNKYDKLTITCVVTNTTFVAYDAQGSNLTVV